MKLKDLLELPRASAQPCAAWRTVPKPLPRIADAFAAPERNPHPLPVATRARRVTVTPHSTAASAALATVRTLESLPMAGFAADPYTAGEAITGTATNASFLKFAAERQGYVRLVTIL